MIIHGFATQDGTAHYRDRIKDKAASNYFRLEQDLWISSLGIGTYLGKADDATDMRYAESVKLAIGLGANVIDAAANYRFQRSERSIGAALQQLKNSAQFNRDELIVCTKGGYLPFDGQPPANVREYVQETFVKTGIASTRDFAGGSHCMTPSYLQSQIDQSLQNLKLDCIDVYYLHNPESHLGEIEEVEFKKALRAAFELFEQNIKQGKIRRYGVATWNGFRVAPEQTGYHSLEMMAELARDAGGESNGFRFIQLPFNLAMPEALLSRNHRVHGKWCSVIEAAGILGISVVASASLLQGKVARGLSEEVREAMGSLATDAQTAVQFVRSTPGITTALVGMSQPEHVEENLQLVRLERASSDSYERLYAQAAAQK